MMDPPDERPVSVAESHEVDSPERSIPFQPLLEQAGDAVAQPGGVDRMVVMVFHHVLGHREIGIGHPSGGAVGAGRQPSGERGRQVDAIGDPRP